MTYVGSKQELGRKQADQLSLTWINDILRHNLSSVNALLTIMFGNNCGVLVRSPSPCGDIKGIRDAGSTADFRILFEILKF